MKQLKKHMLGPIKWKGAARRHTSVELLIHSHWSQPSSASQTPACCLKTLAARRREHPELTELLCVELMTRQLDAQSAAALHQQHAMLACLVPWMENISFAARWEGDHPPHRPSIP